MVRELETPDYYRERAKVLRALADDETNPETEAALRHIASNFETIADLIDMMNRVKPAVVRSPEAAEVVCLPLSSARLRLSERFVSLGPGDVASARVQMLSIER